MNSTISVYWNTFQQECPLCVSSNPQNILMASHVPWDKFRSKEITALSFSLSQLEILGNPLPSIQDFIILVDAEQGPQMIIQVTHLEVLPQLALEDDMQQKIGNDIQWKNYFARDICKKNSPKDAHQLVVYIEFKQVY